MMVFRLTTPYASTMKIARTANPTGYSGMTVVVTVKLPYASCSKYGVIKIVTEMQCIPADRPVVDILTVKVPAGALAVKGVVE